MPGVQRHEDGKLRCAWCTADPLYVAYHDTEWGVPVHDDRQLFEMLCLEGAQAGLSWLTILRKRESYRAAFDDFDAEAMARYDAAKRRRLLRDPGIVRNRLKVDAFVSNARCYLDICDRRGAFSDYIWQFTDRKVLRRRPLRLGEIAQLDAAKRCHEQGPQAQGVPLRRNDHLPCVHAGGRDR